MAELRFLGLSQDGTQLLLADSRGRKHTVGVDARLMAAMRLDGPPTGQREIALNSTFSPREIQARLRSGATVADLADEYGVDVVRIERFAGPPMADRAYASDQARATVVNSSAGDRPLETVVTLAIELDSPDQIQWDAWLREDGRWQILTSYPVGALDQVATWIFDPQERTVIPDDDTSRELLGGSKASGPVSLVSNKKATTSTAAKTSATKPSAPDPEPAEQPDDSTPARTAKRGRRASVPTWDEILFGTQSAGQDSD